MKILNPKTVIKFMGQEKEERVGYLWKRRSENKGHFKKRYFVACGNILAYYEKKGDKDPLGLLLLEGHVIEMLDDLTMALRFPYVNECVRSYVLRGETTEDVEQWMRILTRSGIDFFNLTLEDLEDQFTAVNTVQKSLSMRNRTLNSDQNTSSRRTNPFNRTSIIYGELVEPPSRTRSERTKASPKIFVASNAGRSTILTTRERSPPPVSKHHILWLLGQSWDDLHARVRAQLFKNVEQGNLIDL